MVENDPAISYENAPLPPGIGVRRVAGINGLDMQVLEAGREHADRPPVLLLHGFPEIAYSWRKVMPAIADAGYHVIAPDQRGYGGTTGWSADFDGDLAPFRMLNLIRDALALVFAFGHRSVSALVGHDYGSFVTAWSALARPDVFRAAIMMSAPFAGPPSLPFGTAAGAAGPADAGAEEGDDIHAALLRLSPPRKHYQWYYSTREANPDMWHSPQGIHDFLRAYYHHKSADWKANKPYRLDGWTAEALAALPTYYVMEADKGMAESVASEMPSPEEIAACAWLPDEELAVYARIYGARGFQGGLNWYRCDTGGANAHDMRLLAGRSIDVPTAFIAGRSDWGIYQKPGALEAMQETACSRMLGCHILDGAGHWVQQEQPEAVSRLIVDFLAQTADTR